MTLNFQAARPSWPSPCWRTAMPSSSSSMLPAAQARSAREPWKKQTPQLKHRPHNRGLRFWRPPVSITHTIALPSRAVLLPLGPALSPTPRDVNVLWHGLSDDFYRANYTVSDTAQRRAPMNLPSRPAEYPTAWNFVFYVVNSGELFIVRCDPVTTATPLLNGVVGAAANPGGGFTNASLNGNMVISLTGHSRVAPPREFPKPS